MKLRIAKLMLISTLLFNLSSAATPDKPKLEATFGNWSVYTWVEDGQKVCIASSNPIEKYGNYSRRSTPYIWVRNISKNIDEVSVTTGYPYKKDSAPELTTYKLASSFKDVKDRIIEGAKKGNCAPLGDGSSYTFDVKENEQAWVQNVDHDEQIINEIKEGNYVLVTGYSLKGTCSADIYSAAGFTKAYNKMKELC